MAFIQFNPNPDWNYVGDCTVRAISRLTDTDWDSTYINLALQGFMMKDMPSSNHVWGAYLRSRGYERVPISNKCPDCYTVADFASENPIGTFLLATGTHVVTVEDGNYYDTWDSGDEVPIYYWSKEDDDAV